MAKRRKANSRRTARAVRRGRGPQKKATIGARVALLEAAVQTLSREASAVAIRTTAAIPAWLDPTPAMLDDPVFNAIWDVIKSWDVNVPGVYAGYCGANGNHVRLIYDAVTREREMFAEVEPAKKEPELILPLISEDDHDVAPVSEDQKKAAA